MKKIFLAIALSFFFLTPAFARVEQTFDIVNFPKDGQLDVLQYPIQRQMFSANGDLVNVLLWWGGATEITPTTTAINRLILRDKTASVSYSLWLQNTANPTHPFAEFATTTATITLDSTHHYEWQAFGNYNFSRRSPSSTYNNLGSYDEAGFRSSIPDGGFTASNYDIYVRADTTADTNTTINFTATPTSTCDFDSWGVKNWISDTDLPAFHSEGWSAQVMYGIAPEFMVYQDNAGGFGSASYPWSITKTQNLYGGYAYYAQASICDSTATSTCDFSVSANLSHRIAYSPVWEFIIGDNTVCSGQKLPTQGFVWPTSTSTNPIDNFTCDPNSNFFSYSLCNLLNWLFIPPQSSFNQFSQLKTALENKPPFGYFLAYKSAFDSLDSTASSTVSSTAPTAEVLGTITIFGTIRTIFAWIFWLVFGGYMIWRFKHFIL